MNARPLKTAPPAAPAIAELLTPLWLQHRLAQLGVTCHKWAVALSGGPDSTALMAMLAQLNVRTMALIVDHSLRPESAAEAAQTAKQAQRLGLRTRILRWEGDKPPTGLMAAARQARYQLLLKACAEEGMSHLFLAHHADDQQETAQLRRRRGSGWRGLAGMPFISPRGEVTLARPLLDVSKQALLDYCAAHQLSYATDPSNSNPRFARAQLRLQPAPVLHLESRRRQRELDALRAQEGQLYRWHGQQGVVALPLADFFSSSLRLPLLRELLVSIGQEEHPASEAALEDLLNRLSAGHRGGTLAGCRLRVQGLQLLIAREPAAMEPLVLAAGHHHIHYDRRWVFDVALSAPAVVAPLGAASWRKVVGGEQLESWYGIARAAFPGIWQAGQLVRVPSARYVPVARPLVQIFAIT